VSEKSAQPPALPFDPGPKPDPWGHPFFLDLNDKQRAFVKAYLTDCRGNASAAIRAAGYKAKATNVAASQVIRQEKVAKALDACRPLADALTRWEIRNTPEEKFAQAETPAELRPRWKRRDAVAWLEAIIAGKDPNAPDLGPEPELRVFAPRFQDRLKALEILIRLKRGWDQGTKVTVEGNPKKPILHSAVHTLIQGLSEAEIMSRYEELKARAPMRVQALPMSVAAPQPTEEIQDAETAPSETETQS
jgi:hypothetical protein